MLVQSLTLTSIREHRVHVASSTHAPAKMHVDTPAHAVYFIKISFNVKILTIVLSGVLAVPCT